MTAPVQNFGNTRIVKREAGKTLGDAPGYLVTDASDALEVHIMEMPPITVSVPPVSVNLSVVSVTQGTSPWVVAGDVSTVVTLSTVSVTGQVSVLGPVSVTGHVSIDNASTNPVQVTVQSFQTAVSVTGDVSIHGNASVDVTDRANRVLGTVSVGNFPTVTSVTQGTSPWVIAGDVSLKSAVSVTGQVSVVGPVSVTGQVSVVGPVSVTGHVSIDNASTNPVQITVQSFQTAVSVTGQVSVAGNVSATVIGAVSVVGQVSVVGPVSVTGHVSIDNTFIAVAPVAGTSFHIEGNVSATVIGAVSVVGQVSVLGNVSVATARVNLTAGTPTHASVAATTCLALAANAGRKGLVITNKNLTSIAGIPVYLGLATVAVLGSGIVLYPNGGTWTMDEYTFTTGSIAAVASAGAVASLAIQEFS